MTEETRRVMTGAQAIVTTLEALGVTDVFGMPGGAILPTYDPISVRLQETLEEPLIVVLISQNCAEQRLEM